MDKQDILNEMTLISVVVPAYNSEKTLKSTLDDILSQTYRQFELILVDDGSKDSTAEICDQYALKDKRIKVIHQNNGGLSCARNNGTQKASGEYITYIDSDDRINKRYLEYMIRAVTETKADLACGSIDRIREDAKPENQDNEYTVTVFNQKEFIREMLTGKRITVSACCRLVPTKWMVSNPFLDGTYYEDLSNTYKVNLMSQKAAFVDAAQYHYVMRGGSITGQKKITEKQCCDYYFAINTCTDSISKIYPEIEKDIAVLKAKDYMALYLNIHRCPESSSTLTAMEQDVLKWMKGNWKKAAGNSMAPRNVRLRAMLFGISPHLYEKLYYYGIRFKGKKIK